MAEFQCVCHQPIKIEGGAVYDDRRENSREAELKLFSSFYESMSIRK